MPPNHEAAIEHLNKQLAEHGIVSFAEVNKMAGASVLYLGTVLGNQHSTGRLVKKLMDEGTHTLVSLPTRVGKSSQRRGKPPRTSYYLVESDLEPFVKHAQASARTGAGSGKPYDPLVNALFTIDEEASGNELALRIDSKGTRKLARMGLLKRIRFKYGETPVELKSMGAGKYRIINPELMERAIKAVKRAIEIQETRLG